jgi:hypothetical protein
MNNTQLQYLVEGFLILASTVFGILVGRAGKPYSKVKLVIHLFFFLWFTVGLAFILYGHLATGGTKATWIPDGTMGLMTLIQIGTGIKVMASKKSGKALPMTHMISTILMLLADICAFVIAGNPS